MDIAWIKVFVLTLAECIAPPGKSVCQQHEFELQFLTEADCNTALEQLLTLKQESANVIVNHARSACTPSARQTDTFASLEAINAANSGTLGWREPGKDEQQGSAANAAYDERLARLKTCEETKGTAPCKVGQIIIEGADGDAVDVWRRD